MPDLTGHGNDLTLKGGAVAAFGELSLDGNSQYGEFPSNFLVGVNAYSVACWVKFVGVGSWMRIWDFGTGTDSYLLLSATEGTDGIPAYYARLNGGDHQTVKTTQALPLNKWVHMTVTYDGTRVSIYRNGALDVTLQSTIKPADLGPTARYWIGRSQYDHDAFFTGSYRDFRVFSRALSPEEVQKLTQGLN